MAIRKAQAGRRGRERKLIAAGKLRVEAVSLAAALGPEFTRGPIDVSHIKLGGPDFFDEAPRD